MKHVGLTIALALALLAIPTNAQRGGRGYGASPRFQGNAPAAVGQGIAADQRTRTETRSAVRKRVEPGQSANQQSQPKAQVEQQAIKKHKAADGDSQTSKRQQEATQRERESQDLRPARADRKPITKQTEQKAHTRPRP